MIKKETLIPESKKLIYSWRVLAELHYLKNMIEEKEASREDILKVINNYIDFTRKHTDAEVLCYKELEWYNSSI